jgi:uncharacterized membrane protein
MSARGSRQFNPHIQRYLLAGLLALAPLWVTWLVFNFLLAQLSRAGRPWVQGVARGVEPVLPGLAQALLHPWFESALAVLFTLLALYLLGWATTQVLGRRLLAGFEGLLDRVPLAKAVYRMTKQLVETLQRRPEGVQRVVLIRFPWRGMKTIGFVTRVLTDSDTGRKLAVVYVPTAPNPTSGYMEIVPLEDVISTDWSVDEAMRFVVTAGTASPDRLHYEKSAPGAQPLDG